MKINLDKLSDEPGCDGASKLDVDYTLSGGIGLRELNVGERTSCKINTLEVPFEQEASLSSDFVTYQGYPLRHCEPAKHTLSSLRTREAGVAIQQIIL